MAITSLMQLRIIKAGIPLRYRQSRFEHLEQDVGNMTALQAAREFAGGQRDKEGLLFIGPSGTGKTHLAAVLALEELKRTERVVFKNTSELLLEIKETYRDSSSSTESALISTCSQTDLLILDDLGAERITGWTQQIFYFLINRRYESMKPIIATTNIPIGKLESVFDSRLISRLAGMCRVLKMDGDDRRLSSKKGC